MPDDAGCVLVVDDDPMVRELVPLLLPGVSVEVAASGARARELVTSRPGGVTALAVDHRLPDVDGIDLVSELRGLGLAADVPVVVMSGSLDERLRRRAEEAGLALVDKRDLASLGDLLGSGGHAAQR